MKAKDLHVVWSAPDNTRLTTKQFSFRLPVHVAAKLAALGEIYPAKSRTQLVADLLSASLQDLEGSFPSIKGRFFTNDPDTGAEVFEDVGLHARYASLANKFFEDLERELGNEQPGTLVPMRVITANEERQ
jgi:hypothetical protein